MHQPTPSILPPSVSLHHLITHSLHCLVINCILLNLFYSLFSISHYPAIICSSNTKKSKSVGGVPNIWSCSTWHWPRRTQVKYIGVMVMLSPGLPQKSRSLDAKCDLDFLLATTWHGKIIYAVHREEADVDWITDDWELSHTPLCNAYVAGAVISCRCWSSWMLLFLVRRRHHLNSFLGAMVVVLN